MIRKIQANRDLRFIFIPKVIIEMLELDKGQDVDVRVTDGKIIITPCQSAIDRYTIKKEEC